MLHPETQEILNGLEEFVVKATEALEKAEVSDMPCPRPVCTGDLCGMEVDFSKKLKARKVS